MKRSDLMVQRSDWALLFAGLMMLVGPWVTANLDAAPPTGVICVTMPGTQECNTTGSTGCGASPGGYCGGTCHSCNSTVVLPNKVCMTVHNTTGDNCPRGAPVNCGSNNNRLLGNCGKVGGSNNCTCNNAVPSGTCGSGFIYPAC